MTPDFNMLFLILFVMLFTALGISSMINKEKYKGSMMFGLLYLVAAVILVVYKINN